MFEVMDLSDGLVAHYNNLVMPRSMGGVKISEDTSTLLSKEHIKEFVIPYLTKILEYFGGGWVHWCGKNDHLFEALLDVSLAYCINFGNPEKHDMEYVLRKTAERNKIYHGCFVPSHGEKWEDYFCWMREATIGTDGILKVIPIVNCTTKDRTEIMTAWEKVMKYK